MRIEWPAPDIGKTGAEVFTETIRRLEDIPHVVGFGTALGVYRDGTVVPDDSDIDICIRGEQLDAVRDAFGDWPLAHTRPRHGANQFLYYPRRIIVDVSVWKPHDAGIEWDRYSFPRNMFDAEWVDTEHGRVPLPHNVETYLETLYGDWRTRVYRGKPE